MRMGAFTLVICLVVSLAVSHGELGAQGQQESGEGALIVGGFNFGLTTAGGDDFGGVDTGFGGEFTARYLLPTGLSLGLGLGVSSHDVSGFRNDLRFVSLLGEIRYEVDAGPPALRPFLGARAGYRGWGIDVPINGLSVSASADGGAVGGFAGFEAPIGPALSVEAAVHGGLMRFGDASAAGFTGTDTSLDGHFARIQVGVSIKRSMF